MRENANAKLQKRVELVDNRSRYKIGKNRIARICHFGFNYLVGNYYSLTVLVVY